MDLLPGGIQPKACMVKRMTGHATRFPLMALLDHLREVMTRTRGPRVSLMEIEFEGYLSRDKRGEVCVALRRGRFAWMARTKPRRLKVRCDAGNGWIPRLYCDGEAIVSPGTLVPF